MQQQEYRRVLATVLDLEQKIGYETGYVYTGHTLKKKKSTWLLILRVQSVAGDKYVAFVESSSAYDCWYLVHKAIHSTAVTLKWRRDKY